MVQRGSRLADRPLNAGCIIEIVHAPKSEEKPSAEYEPVWRYSLKRRSGGVRKVNQEDKYAKLERTQNFQMRGTHRVKDFDLWVFYKERHYR